MGLFDNHPYRRDTHGPMDLDGDESEKKLEGFMNMAVDDPEEPSRKRQSSRYTTICMLSCVADL